MGKPIEDTENAMLFMGFLSLADPLAAGVPAAFRALIGAMQVPATRTAIEGSPIGVVGAEGTTIGQWCRVGDDPYDWYQWTGSQWIMRFSDQHPVAYNTTQAVYQKLVISGAAGDEFITITDL